MLLNLSIIIFVKSLDRIHLSTYGHAYDDHRCIWFHAMLFSVISGISQQVINYF
jgi:hypothetical protein